MFDGAERFGVRSNKEKLFFQNRFVAVEFDVGKFPEMSIDHSGGTLSDEKFFLSFHDERDEVAGGWGNSFFEIRKFLDAIFPMRDAKLFHRTDRAFCLARCANQC